MQKHGKNHSSISDENGFVYSVGLNTKGNLGTEDNSAKVTFTKIGETEVKCIPEEINIPVNTTKEVIIALCNSFNLKTDIATGERPEATSTNEKELTCTRIEGVDNREYKNIKHAVPNFRLVGEKIGRVNVVAKNSEGYLKNIWVNIVNSETDIASAKVVNGKDFTITLRADGTVWGFGKIADSNHPKKIEVPEEIVDISAGESHVLLLSKSGNVYSFGNNTRGELGTGNVTTYKNPVKTALADITKIIANKNTSFAIDKNGVVYSFGYGYTKTPGILIKNENVVDISRSYYLTDEGEVKKLSDKTKVEINLDENKKVEEKIMQISEGTNHLLLLGISGRVYGSLDNTYGQLGDGTENSKLDNTFTVVKINKTTPLENVKEISAGDKYSIVVTKDGVVYTFGSNDSEKLGISNDQELGGIEKSVDPIQKQDVQDVERVTAGYNHTSVYKKDGSVYTWGKGENRRTWKF